MAVCRGSQLANCYFGGSLHQDLETQVGAAVCHRDAAEYDKVHHQCVFEPHSYLGSIYQAEGSLLQINSVHHQGIRDLGKGLVVEARCPVDGLVEAYRYEDLSDFYLIGVQWHPEFSHTLGNQIISSQPLLEDFLKRCEQQRGS
jgi:putative glutamine amidotransferase